MKNWIILDSILFALSLGGLIFSIVLASNVLTRRDNQDLYSLTARYHVLETQYNVCKEQLDYELSK